MTGKAWRFEPDEAGIKNVAYWPEVGRFLTAIASDARKRIQRHGPQRGFFQFWKSVRFVPAQLGPDGMESAVGSDSPGWHLQEFGTAQIAPRAAIRKGVQDVGVELRD